MNVAAGRRVRRKTGNVLPLNLKITWESIRQKEMVLLLPEGAGCF